MAPLTQEQTFRRPRSAGEGDAAAHEFRDGGESVVRLPLLLPWGGCCVGGVGSEGQEAVAHSRKPAARVRRDPPAGRAVQPVEPAPVVLPGATDSAVSDEG